MARTLTAQLWYRLCCHTVLYYGHWQRSFGTACTVQHYMLNFDSAASVQLALYNNICYTLTVQLWYSYTVQYYTLHFDSAASVQLHCTILYCEVWQRSFGTATLYNIITRSLTAQLQYSYTVQYYKRWTLTAELLVQAMLYLTSISGWLPEICT